MKRKLLISAVVIFSLLLMASTVYANESVKLETTGPCNFNGNHITVPYYAGGLYYAIQVYDLDTSEQIYSQSNYGYSNILRERNPKQVPNNVIYKNKKGPFRTLVTGKSANDNREVYFCTDTYEYTYKKNRESNRITAMLILKSIRRSNFYNTLKRFIYRREPAGPRAQATGENPKKFIVNKEQNTVICPGKPQG